MTVVSFGKFLPDLPAHQNPGLLVCKNVVSRTPDSYGPFLDLAAYSGALAGGRCQGAFTARDDAGNIEIYAGTGTTLERLTSASTSWENVSIAGGYTTATDAQWSFAQFGQRIIAVNGVDPPQSYVMGSSTDFADLSADAPIGAFVCVVKEFVVIGRIAGNPERVHWSAQNDPTSWPTPGSAAAAAVQSDFQDLFEGGGGWVQGMVSGLESADLIVWQERQIFRGSYIGPPAIFQFKSVEGVRGTPAPGSINKFGTLVDYIGEDGRYLFNGTASQPIGANEFDKSFFSDVDQTYLNNISSTVDPINKLFFQAYPDGSASGGVPNKIQAWNWSTQRASLIEISGGIEYLFRAGTFGYNLDNADGLGWNVDTSPFGPDSRFWTGGRSILAAFNSEHKLCFFSGNALEATLETGDLDLAEGYRVRVTGTRPIVDTESVTCSVGYRNQQSASVSYTTANAPSDDGYCPHNINARYVRSKTVIAAGASWSHAKGVEPKFRREGQV